MFNRVIILGNLTRDPEIRIIPGLNQKVAKAGIASNRKFKNKAGELKEEVLFIDIVAFGRNAEVMEEYLKKGSQILVEGRLTFSSWEQEGVKRSKHEISVESFQMVGGRGGNADFAGGESSNINTSYKELPTNAHDSELSDDDIPF